MILKAAVRTVWWGSGYADDLAGQGEAWLGLAKRKMTKGYDFAVAYQNRINYLYDELYKAKRKKDNVRYFAVLCVIFREVVTELEDYEIRKWIADLETIRKKLNVVIR